MFQVMTFELFSVTPLPEPMATYCQFELQGTSYIEISNKYEEI